MNENEMLNVLKEILKWTKIQALPSTRDTLRASLTDSSHRRLYQALDGRKTQKELASSCGLAQPSVSRLVSAWQRTGIAEEISPGKYRKSFDLVDLGIEVEGGK
jgi:CRP-like cAMP-binding protein